MLQPSHRRTTEEAYSESGGDHLLKDPIGDPIAFKQLQQPWLDLVYHTHQSSLPRNRQVFQVVRNTPQPSVVCFAITLGLLGQLAAIIRKQAAGLAARLKLIGESQQLAKGGDSFRT